MNRKELERALTELTRLLQEKYDGAAAISLAAGHYILTIRELGGNHSIHGTDPGKMLDALMGKGCVCDVGDEQVMVLYRMYPRSRDIGAARRAIRSALNDREIPHADRYLYLQTAVDLYRRHCPEDPKMIPYPATWFNRKSYLNEQQAVLKCMQTMMDPNNQPSSATPRTAAWKPKTS